MSNKHNAARTPTGRGAAASGPEPRQENRHGIYTRLHACRVALWLPNDWCAFARSLTMGIQALSTSFQRMKHRAIIRAYSHFASGAPRRVKASVDVREQLARQLRRPTLYQPVREARKPIRRSERDQYSHDE